MARLACFTILCVFLTLGACGGEGTEPMPSPPAPTPDASGELDTATTPDVAPEVTEPTPTPQCNPYLEGAEVGCETGQKCVFPEDDSMNTFCTPSGTKGFGEACEGVGDCIEGICTSLSGTEQLCYEYCKTSAHCTGGQECLDISEAPYGLCENDVTFDSCDLLAQDCQDPEKACYIYSGEGPVCLPSGNGVAGDGCGGNSDCSASHVCINGICKSMCNQNQPDPCGGFIPCSGYYGNVGYCDS